MSHRLLPDTGEHWTIAVQVDVEMVLDLAAGLAMGPWDQVTDRHPDVTSIVTLRVMEAVRLLAYWTWLHVHCTLRLFDLKAERPVMN